MLDSAALALPPAPLTEAPSGARARAVARPPLSLVSPPAPRAQPETSARLANLGAEIKIGTPAEFGKLLANELAQWTAVAKAANIKVE